MSREDNKRKIKIALTLEGRHIQTNVNLEKAEENMDKVKIKEPKSLTEKTKKDTFFEEPKEIEEQKNSKNIVRTFSIGCL